MNTDRELWRASDSYYAPSAFVTEQGAIGIQVGGLAIVKTVTGWHNCAQLAEQLSIAEQARAAEQPVITKSVAGSSDSRPYEESVCKNCGKAIWRITDGLGKGWMHRDQLPNHDCVYPRTHAEPVSEPAQPNCIPAVPQVPESVLADYLWRAAKWNRITWECRSDFLAWRPAPDNVGVEVLVYNYATLQIPSGNGLFSIEYAPSLEAIGGNPTQPLAGDVVERIVQRFAEMEGEDDLTEHAKVAIEIAREGYVSLAEHDAQWEKAIRVEATRVLYGPKAAETFLTSVRARLAKPAEQTDEGVTVHKDSNDWWIVEKYDSAYGKFAEQDAAERYAAGLREELKAGKQ